MTRHRSETVQRRSSSHSSCRCSCSSLFAIVDLGWVFNQQLAVSGAAREGVRYYAIHHTDANAVSLAEDRAEALVATAITFTVVTPCTTAPDATATVRVTTPISDLTGLVQGLAPGRSLTGKGAMRCGG